MKAKQLIFIDDSGDAGIKVHSSSHLVMSAIVFNDDLVAEEVALEMRKFKRQLGWTDNHEYKFNKTKKDYVKQVLRLVSGYDFDVYAVMVNKAKFETAPKNLYNDAKRAISQVRKNANPKTGQISDIKFGDSKEMYYFNSLTWLQAQSFVLPKLTKPTIKTMLIFLPNTS